MTAHRSGISRRRFLQVTGAAAGVAATRGLDAFLPRQAIAARPSSTSRYPLRRLSVQPPGPLTAAPATADVGGGQLSNVLAYNGAFPGPAFLAWSGDSVSIPFTNGLSEPTTVHWHGMVVPTAVDGQPQDPVARGGSFTYQFQINQRAAMNWYHPHPDMIISHQVALGLAGGFIVRDSEEAALNLPSGPYELPLVIRDADFDSAGNLIYKPRSSGYLGHEPMVNGTRKPTVDVDTAIYRVRVLNGANGRVFRLALTNGVPFVLIGTDGGLLAASVQLAEIVVAPAERLDLLVDFRAVPVGTKIMLRCLDAGWDILEFVVKQKVSAGGTIPTALSTIPTLVQNGATRVFSFDGMSRINGKVYDLNRIDFTAVRGNVERWRFSTGGNAPHPVHIHGASFQVVSRTGGRGEVFPWERGWKDTVLLQDGETVEALIRFGLAGRYLMHCHKLEHEDSGMMVNFNVV